MAVYLRLVSRGPFSGPMIPGQVTLRALAAISTEARSSRPKWRDLSVTPREQEVSPFRGYATAVEMTVLDSVISTEARSSRPKWRDLSVAPREQEISPFRGYATAVEMTGGHRHLDRSGEISLLTSLSMS
jgi:hypothetical protein